MNINLQRYNGELLKQTNFNGNSLQPIKLVDFDRDQAHINRKCPSKMLDSLIWLAFLNRFYESNGIDKCIEVISRRADCNVSYAVPVKAMTLLASGMHNWGEGEH